jgi:hypothetical protein
MFVPADGPQLFRQNTRKEYRVRQRIVFTATRARAKIGLYPRCDIGKDIAGLQRGDERVENHGSALGRESWSSFLRRNALLTGSASCHHDRKRDR